MRAGDWTIRNRPMEDRRHNAESHGHDPDQIIGTSYIKHIATKPGAKKAANLVTKKYDSIKGTEISRAKYPRYQAARKRNGSQPKEADQRSEYQNRSLSNGKYKKTAYAYASCKVIEAKNMFLPELTAQPTRGKSTQYVEQPDQCYGGCAEHPWHFVVGQERWEMRCNKGNVEATDEKSATQ